VTVVSDVWSIDNAKQTVHVRGPRGHVVEVKVRDPALLQDVSVGDQVEVSYAVGGIVRLEPVAAP